MEKEWIYLKIGVVFMLLMLVQRMVRYVEAGTLAIEGTIAECPALKGRTSL